MDEQLNIAFDWLGQHIVCWLVRYRYLDKDGNPKGPEYPKAMSCFVIEIEGSWLLVTSGHAFRDEENEEGLDYHLERNQITITSSDLIDCFGKGASVRESTPFPFDVFRWYINDEHLDFAIIPLRDLFREGLQNNGIIPFNEKNWTLGFTKDCDFYVTLGFDEARFNQMNLPTEVGERTELKIAPSLVVSRKMKDEDIPDIAKVAKSHFPWFHGKLTHPLENMKGLSGGPIFGISRRDDGQTEYFGVAVQSAWFPQSKIVRGCPILCFVEYLKAVTEDVAVRQQATHVNTDSSA